MSKITQKHIAIFLLIASIFALALAYISQYIFHYQPCILCFHQRKPFWLITFLILVSLYIPSLQKHQKIIILTSILLIIINIVIAAYHVGVEQKIFQGPDNCSSNIMNIVDMEELKMALSKTKAVRCDTPELVVFGISMAGWNLVYCLFLLVTSAFLSVKAFRNRV